MSSQSMSSAPAPATALDPDGAIVERIRAGETVLYEVLIRRYNQRLYRVARAFLHDDSGIEDVMQEAYLKAFTGLSRFQGRARFSTWLTRILINCAVAYVRSRSRRAEVTLDSAVENGIAVGGHSTFETEGEQTVAREQIGKLIDQAIDSLPVAYRVVFVLRELEHMTVADTAACLGISSTNAKVRLHRAKKLLRDSLRSRIPEIVPYRYLGERCDRMTARVMNKIESIGRQGLS